MNPWTKRILLHLAREMGVFRSRRRRLRRALRILAYHGVDDAIPPALNPDGFFVSSSVFRSHLEVLRDFRVIALDEAVAAGEWPDDAVAITFDDGYANNLETAAPILDEFGFPATFFLATDYISGADYPWWFRVRAAAADGQITGTAAEWEERLKNMSESARAIELQRLPLPDTDDPRLPRMLAWEDVRRLRDEGFSVGGHTARHISFAHESDEVIAREIDASLEAMRNNAVEPGTWYSYPFGGADHVRPVREAFSRAGIRGAVTDLPGRNAPGDDPYMMRRISLTGHHEALTLEALLCL